MMISSHLTRRAVLAGGTAIVGLAAVKANAAPRRVVWWYEGATAAQQAALEQSLVKPSIAWRPESKLFIRSRGSGLPDQLLVALSAGSGPDIILTNGPAWTQRMVIAKRLLPLNDLAKKFEWDKRIVPFMLGMGTYDGTMYALPKTTETQVLFYNDTLFKKNGWTPPTDRAAFEALADKMIKAGVQPLAAGNAGARYVNRHYVGASFSCCAGPDSVYNALSGKLPWNDPVFVESIQLLKNWWDKGYFGGPKYFALSGQQSFALMAIGKRRDGHPGKLGLPVGRRVVQENRPGPELDTDSKIVCAGPVPGLPARHWRRSCDQCCFASAGRSSESDERAA